MREGRRNPLELFVRKFLTIDEASKEHTRMQWIGSDVAVLVASLHGPPVARAERAELPSARDSRGAAVLLCAVNPVGILIVGGDVVKLAVRLVVPGTPRFAAVQCNDGALIATQNHALRLVGVDPQFVIIVAVGCAPQSRKGFPAVARLIKRSVRDIDAIRIFRINGYFAEVPPSSPSALLVRNALPVLPAIV